MYHNDVGNILEDLYELKEAQRKHCYVGFGMTAYIPWYLGGWILLYIWAHAVTILLSVYCVTINQHVSVCTVPNRFCTIVSWLPVRPHKMYHIPQCSWWGLVLAKTRPAQWVTLYKIIGLFYKRDVVVSLFTHVKLIRRLVTTLFAHAQFLGEFGTFVKSTLWLCWLFIPARCLCCPCFMDEEMMKTLAYIGIMLAFGQSYRMWQFTLKLINCERFRMLLSSDVACISDFKTICTSTS